MNPTGYQCQYHWLHRREIGLKQIGNQNKFMKELYTNIAPYKTWDSDHVETHSPGGIFNVEFSPDGSLLVAACERKNLLLFDPYSQKCLRSVEGAHFDCVNCVKFIDDKSFATCSDDQTVALWDTRNLDDKLRVLSAHSNWVKNVEYLNKDKRIITSGFDGNIYSWDLNGYTENSLLYNKIFHTNGLMRMKLSPDGSKMIICTTTGYIMVVHDLNLETLQVDLAGFRPNIYRLMQIGETPMPMATRYSHLFDKHRKQNRVEFITDFPPQDAANVISSLQVHPKGSCILTRNLTIDEYTEWTCVHNVQDVLNDASDNKTDCFCESNSEDSDSEYSEEEERVVIISGPRSTEMFGRVQSPAEQIDEHQTTPVEGETSVETSAANECDSIRTTIRIRSTKSASDPSHSRNVRLLAIGDRTFERPIRLEDTFNDDDEYQSRLDLSRLTSTLEHNRRLKRVANSKTTRFRSSKKRSLSKRKIYKNKKRLMHYIEEVNAGKGFIKEPCFSTDGNFISSPYMFGIRILSFPDDQHAPAAAAGGQSCAEQISVTALKQINIIPSHRDLVLCTKFSPVNCLLVSGCHSGELVWYQPSL